MEDHLVEVEDIQIPDLGYLYKYILDVTEGDLILVHILHTPLQDLEEEIDKTETNTDIVEVQKDKKSPKREVSVEKDHPLILNHLREQIQTQSLE